MKKRKKLSLVKNIKDKLSKWLGIPFGDNIEVVLEHKMKKGNKQLIKSREGVTKQLNPKIIHEFDKLAKKKSNKFVEGHTKLKMHDDLQLKKKIFENIKKLFHPFKNSKKKKEVEILFSKK